MKTLLILALLQLLSAPLALAGAPEIVTVPVVRITVEAEVASPPEAVWKQLTMGRNLVTWCPVWKSDANAEVTLARVGDALDFTDTWGNGGRSVVTFIAAGKELRVAHEPNDGSYLCQARITLAPAGKGTRVAYTEQYTDTSPEADRKATAEKMSAEMQNTLAALRRNAETK
jgi:uncharacterized protein YndB with AHSA1/START domain